MQGKRKSVTAVVSEGAAQAVLRRGAARDLAPDEERVMRMRLGAAPPRTEVLERSADASSDLELELLAFEIEAFMKLRERRERSGRTAGPRAPAPVTSRTKEKIVRALRKKG